MPWTKLPKLFTFILTFSLFAQLKANPGEPLPPAPPPPAQLSCEDISSADFAGRTYTNPMKTAYRPSINYEKALNRKFYALYKMNEHGEIPVYSWYQRYEGFECVASFIQRIDYFSPWGCYEGSTCNPVTLVQERSSYVFVEKWVSFKKLCEEMSAKHNPDNNPHLQNDLLTQIKRGNIYGFYSTKGLPEEGLVFNDKYYAAAKKSKGTINLDWKNGNSAANNIALNNPETTNSTDLFLGQNESSYDNGTLPAIPPPLVPYSNTPLNSHALSETPQPTQNPAHQLEQSTPLASTPQQISPAKPAPVVAQPSIEATAPNDPVPQTILNDSKAPKYPAADIPLAIPAKGKDGSPLPGFYYSPNDKDASGNPAIVEEHVIDLRGKPSGTKVADPWNNKKPMMIP